MNDPVSEELARRAAQPVSWRGALSVSVLVHLVVLAALVMASRPTHRALSLPAVRVRVAPMMLGPSAPANPRVDQPSTRGISAQKHTAKPTKTAPREAVVAATTQKAAPKAASRKGVPDQTENKPLEHRGDSPSPSPPALAAGGVGIGVAPRGGEGPPFPYEYYLTRVVATIEDNWFRPPVPPGTRCRVLCRIGRSGELKEAGVEEPSGVAAFDRAALRAVYAAAPFPPLPQGFSGSELVLHLEFGQ